jgi:hypothetical protein
VILSPFKRAGMLTPMRPLASYLTAAVLLAAPNVCLADFIGNRTQWDALNANAKASYITGAYDGVNVRYFDDSRDIQAIKAGREACVIARKINTEGLARLVDEGYASDTSRSSLPPYAVLMSQLSRTCAEDIQRERAKLGLPSAG